ncbi:hypothetical protein HD841_003263 [Sphingomonas melonis]|jgi:hypothetical protein|uniref:Uncharacterized protein n=1 Tax=Sphingomonas melonis TaxID=152682 RepID=A0A7Y9FQ94_9SPHN|nr:hypothetical protein [Sphingomonas melonis]
MRAGPVTIGNPPVRIVRTVEHVVGALRRGAIAPVYRTRPKA